MAVPAPLLPDPRGPVSEVVIEQLRGRSRSCRQPPAAHDDPLDGDDSNLALYLCYELHYRGFAGVAEELEWDPSLLTLRAELGPRLEGRVLDVVPMATPVGHIEDDIVWPIENAEGPSLSTYMAER